MKGKCYNMKEGIRELGVIRQTLYYWIKKKWIKPKRDYRNFPVFTENDILNIKEWRERLKE